MVMVEICLVNRASMAGFRDVLSCQSTVFAVVGRSNSCFIENLCLTIEHRAHGMAICRHTLRSGDNTTCKVM